MIRGDEQRLRAAMHDADVDAVLAFTPQNMQYLVGYQAPSLILKVVGAYSALLCADASRPPAMVAGEFDSLWARRMSGVEDVRDLQLWVEIEDLEDVEAGTTKVRPKQEQFDWDQVFSHLRGVLGDRDLLDGSTVACELESLPGHFRSRLVEEFDGVSFVDSHELLERAMAIKSADEIATLRRSVALSELGLRAVLLDDDPRGKSGTQLRNEYELAVRAAVADDPELEGFWDCRVFLTVGANIGPNTSRDDTVVRDGDVVWIDCGVTVDGYQADIGRTIAVGDVPDVVKRVGGALEAGGAAGRELLTVGGSMREVFEATQGAVRENGLPTYTRGHVGHAIGIGGGEHAPFLSPTETAVFEPGMMFAFERPFYVRGLGGFQYEDNYLVTETGVERLTELPTTMLEV